MGSGRSDVIEPNRKFYPPVEEAFEEAQARAVGLNSAEVACLPAQQVEKAATAVESIVALPMSESTTALDKSHAGLVNALATIAALKTASAAKNKVHWAAHQPAKLARLVSQLNASASAATARQAAIKGKKKGLADAAAAAKAARAKAEAAAKAAAAKARADAAAAAALETERVRNLPPVYVPPAPPAYVPPVYVPPAAPAPATNPYPGYTGPRCYAPGGKTWRPCG